MITHLDRTNRGNTGKTFEHELELIFSSLEARRIARIRKVDPPVRIVGGGFARRTIFLPNPFLDYAGVRYESGRAIFLEAKSTATHRLPIGRSGGVTEEQVRSLRAWARAGAFVGVLWRYKASTVFISMKLLDACLDWGDKSLRFEDFRTLSRVEDFLFPP